MSSDYSIARRYAQALIGEAEQQNNLREVDEDVEMIRESLEGSRELVLLFESPLLPRERKADLLKKLFEPRVSRTTLQFLLLLVDKGREGLFPAIVRAYHSLRDERQGIKEARARVAMKLTAEEEQRLKKQLEEVTGSRIRLRVVEDPSLIGGIVVHVGDTVYDGSVQHQLATLREQLEKRTAFVDGLSQ